MDDSGILGTRAIRLFALALQTRDTQPEYADKLVAEAIELQDQAAAIENAADIPTPSQSPQPPTQPKEQVRPKKGDR